MLYVQVELTQPQMRSNWIETDTKLTLLHCSTCTLQKQYTDSPNQSDSNQHEYAREFRINNNQMLQDT